MTSEQRTELLKFLDEQNPGETLQSCSFRLLCFSYENGKRKDWFKFEQENESPIYEAKLVIPSIDKSFHFLQTIQEVKEAIQGKPKWR